MLFRYRARDPMGRRVDGELAATDAAAVAVELKGRALEPLAIEPLARAEAPPALAMEEATTTEELEPARKKTGIPWFGLLLLILYILSKLLG